MVSRTVRKLLSGILILILYFSIFIPLAPQFITLVESFVSRHSSLFSINIPITKFIHNTTSNTITKIVEYASIDLSIVIVFAIYFVTYVAIPFAVIFSVFRR